MQYLIVVLIVLAAAALVIVPLVRAPRGAGAGDLDAPEEGNVTGPETEGGAPRAGRRADDVGPAQPETAGFPPTRRTAPPPPTPVTSPEPSVPPPSAPQPPGEAGAEELPQSAPPPAAPARPLGAPVGGRPRADAATEDEILRYRDALKARTVCAYCSTANPPGSKYCRECGEQFADAGPGEAAGRGARD